MKKWIKHKLATRMRLKPRELQSLLNHNAHVSPQVATKRLLRLIDRLRPISNPATPLIRIGPPGDGGYLLPDDLEGIEACFSPGVGPTCAFDLECANRGIPVYMADHSVDKPAQAHPLFHFRKKHLAAFNAERTMTLDSWVTETVGDSGGDLMLEMDIEGGEYETLLSCSDALMRRFRIIAIEFHMLGALWSQPFSRLAAPVFWKLLATHSCVHIHPNNVLPLVTRHGVAIPPICEFTFLRNDRLQDAVPATDFPHPLDSDNTGKPTVILPEIWYQQPH